MNTHNKSRKDKKEEMSDKEYIFELEKALMFLCECYENASDAVGCREEDGKTSEKYIDLWFHFPIIQGSANIAVRQIADLRTRLGNREANKISMFDIYERIKSNPKFMSQRDIQRSIQKAVDKIK